MERRLESLVDVNPGDVLAGKYRIEQVLGQGGMGLVVAATHVQLEERVAIKFLLPAALQSPEAVARFAREARAAVKIKSEHVARVIDVGTLETGCPYMVMEYLHGRDLGALVHQRGPLGIEESVEYVMQACEAIAEAHALGIVHRDLKPQNLFLSHRADGSPCVKVLDFGISKMSSLTGSDMAMTKTTAVMGSPLYMSPEQMTSSRDVDARTDVWALGVILYELLTGRVPFLADTVPQLCAMILQSEPPPLRNFRPDAPEALQTVLLRCVDKNVATRYQNVAELASGLLPFAPRSGRTSAERIYRVLSKAGISQKELDVPASTGVSPRVTETAFGKTLSTRSSMPWIALGVGVVAVGGAALASLLRAPSDQAGAHADLPVLGASQANEPLSAVPPPTPPPSAAVARGSASSSNAEKPPGPAKALAKPVVPAKPRAKAPPAPVPASKPGAGSAALKPTPAAPPPKPAAATAPAPPPRRPVSDLYSDRK